MDHLADEVTPNDPGPGGSGSKPVTQPAEMSQRTYKLLQLKDRIERKRPYLEKIMAKTKEHLNSDKVAAAAPAENTLQVR